MSNYTNENLINVPASSVPAGTLAIKVGDSIFTAGNVVINGGMDFYKCATVITSVNFDFAGGLDPADGLYVCQNGRMLNGYPVYRKGTTNYYLSYVTNDSWIITDVDPEDDLTEHILFANNESADITDWPEPMTVTYASSGFWTGYKAVFDAVSGTYSFEATATSGLTYGSGITPQIGGVYSDGATIAATLYQGDSLNIPGLVFYAPLSSLSAYAVTGQALAGAADSYTTIQGIPCARFNSLAASLSASDSALPHGNAPVTLSCWLNYSVIPNDFSGILTYGNSQSYGQSIALPDWNSVLFSGAPGENALTSVTPSQGTWYHFLSVYDGAGTIINYVNGVQSGEPYSINLTIGSGDIKIANSEISRDLCMAGIRIYNRVPTPAEIAALANEFTPTA